MKKITLWCMFLFAGLSAIAQTTHNLDWYMGITSADASLTINTGDTVIWTFTDAPSHSVTSDTGSTETFDSGILSTGVGTTYSYTFNTAGTNPYHCAVHPSMMGTITVNAVPTGPSNDDLANATALTLDAVCSGDAYTNVGATAQTGEPSGSCFNDATTGTPDNSVWFSFVAPAGGNVIITTDISPGVLDDSEIAVYGVPSTAGDPSTLPAELGCNQDGNGAVVGSGWMSILDLTGLTPGNTYYIQVDGYNSATGTFCIEVRTPPSAPVNDDLANATALTLDAVCSGDAYTNVAATAQTGEPTGSCFSDNTSGTPDNSVWFSFVAPTSGMVNISTDIAPGAMGDSEIAVYGPPTTPGDPSTLPTELGCNQDGNGAVVGSGYMSILDLTGLTPGNTYYIQVDGYGGFGLSEGAFCIQVNAITCQDPTVLTVANITGTTADLSWTENGTASMWDVHVVPAGDSAPTGTTTPTDVGVMGIPYVKTGLTAGTSYDFYVRSDCGGGDLSEWVGPFTFSTTCPINYTPDYIEDFAVFVPNCWEEADGGDATTGPTTPGSSDWVSDDFLNTGTDQAARLNIFSTGDQNWLISPQIDLTGGTYELTYMVGVTDYASINPETMGTDDQVQVLISTDNGVTWTILKTYDQANSPSELGTMETIDLSGYPSMAQFAFWGTNGSVDDPVDYDFFIDNFAVTPAVCLDPSTLTASNIAPTTVDLGWTENGTAGTWDIEVVTAGTTPTGTPTDVGVTTNPYNKTGLTANTAYDFYVRADCGGGTTSAWIGPFSFTTACGILVAPYTEDFENAGTIPNCWAQGASNSEDWKFDDTVGSNHIGNSGDFYGTTSASGGYFAWVDDSGSHNTGTTLETPSVDVSGLTTPALSFYIVSDNEGNTNVDFSVDFYDGAAWNTAVYTSNTNTGGWIKVFVDLSAYTITGPVQARFIVDENNGTDFYDDVAIDDVAFLELPTCFVPTTLTTANVMATTADLGWTDINTPAATTWDVHVVPAGDPAPTATTTPSDPGVTLNPYNKTGLLPITSYDFYVRADCGGGDFSIWSNPVSFTTACPAAFTPPYVEDFAASVPPECWTESGSGDPTTGPDATSTTSDWLQDDFGNTGTNQAARINLYSNVDQEWLISPTIDLSAGGHELLYNVAVTDYADTFASAMGSDDQVQVLLSTDNGATWSNLLLTYDASNTPSNTGQLEFIDLSAYTSATAKIAFWATDGATIDSEDYDFFIDDFEVRTKASCKEPSALSAMPMTASTADLSWTENNTPAATTWDVHVVTAGSPAPDATTTPSNPGVTTNNPYTVTGLTAQTAYEFYVRTDCGGGDSSIWVGPFGFSTPCVAATIPYTESFTSGTFPSCWTTTSTTDVSVEATCDTRTNVLNISDTNNVTTGPIDGTTATTGLKVSYYVGDDLCGSATEDPFEVSYWDGTQWILAKTYETDATGLPYDNAYFHDSFIVPMSAVTANFKLRFSSNETQAADNWYIDDLMVENAPSCLAPTTLTAANILATTADLGWTDINTPAATMWDVHVVPAGDPAPTATTTPTDPGVMTNPHPKTGLTGNTNYDFYVRTDCGGGTLSGWAGPFTFKTACGAIVAPWFDDLETQPDDTSFTDNNCWTATATTSYDWNVEANGGANSSDTGPDNPYSGAAYFYIEASGSATGEVAELYSPMIDVSGLTAPGLKFYYHMYGVVMGELHVDVHDGTTWVNDVFTLIGQQQTAGSDPWLSALVDLSAYTGTIQIRFRAISAGTFEGDISLDDISVIEMPTCLVPTTLTAGSILTSSADLGWTDTNAPSATLWDVHVVPAGDPAPTSTTVPSDAGVTTNPYNKTGLTSGTTYEFYVRADCGGGTTSLWAGPFMFSTLCSTATLPYSESFTSGTFPVCWTRSSTTDVTIEATCDTRTNVLNISDTNDATTGDIDGTTSTTGLKVSYYIGEDLCGGATEDPFDVEYWDGTQWVLAKTYEIVGTGLPYDNAYFHDSFIVPQSAVTATFKVRFSSNETQALDNWYIDDLVVENAPTCLQPNTLTATNIFATSADLGWTDGNTPSATTWDIEVVTAGTTPTGTPTDVGVTTNPYNKTGLTAQTAYEFYVRTDCGGGDLSAWAGPFAFTTACTAVVAPWSEDFSNGGNIPNCWEQGAANAEDWKFDNTTGFNHIGDNGTIIGNSQSDGYFAWVDDSSPNSIGTTLVSPLIDVSGLSFSELTFYRLSNNEGNTNVDFSVDVWDGAAWNNDMYFSNTNSANGGWEKITVDLSTLTITGDIQIRFVVDENNGTDFYDDVAIDDVDVHERPCYDPSNLTVSNISQTTADISWTDNAQASEWEIEYGPTGFAQGSGTIVLDNDGTLGETLSPLTPATVYDVYVRALCASGDTSGWIGPVTFTTACATLTTLPYTESFESTSPYRVCWKNEYVSSDEDWEFVAANQNGTITPRTGTSMAEFSTTTPSGDVTKFVTPSLDISALNHPQLEFYFANVSWLGDIDELRIYYKTSATGAWTQIGMDYTAEHTTWTKVTLSLPNPSNDYYIAFEGTSNYGRGLDVDDVWVGEGTAACEAPSNLTASNVGSTSADLSWDPAATGGPFEYEWAVFATGADPNVDSPIVTGITAVGTTTATATGLTADTMYDFYVRTICVPGTQSYSDIAGPETFSTTLGIEDQVFEDFSYYPNPVSGTLSLKASQEIQQVVVYDLLGQEVLKNNPDSLTPTLNFHNLQTGTYLMKVTINGAVGIYRIIKE